MTNKNFEYVIYGDKIVEYVSTMTKEGIYTKFVISDILEYCDNEELYNTDHNIT